MEADVVIQCPSCSLDFHVARESLGERFRCDLCGHVFAAEPEDDFRVRDDWVVFDLETTGLAPLRDSIIQIAGVRMREGAILEHDFFDTYVNPGVPIPEFISHYTGVTERDVENAPSPAEALRRFSTFVGDATLVAHNGHRFDMVFIQAACERHALRTRRVQYIDSLALSHRLWGRGCRHGLDVVLARLGIACGPHQRHDARGDVRLLAEAVSRMSRMFCESTGMPPVPRLDGVLPLVP